MIKIFMLETDRIYRSKADEEMGLYGQRRQYNTWYM